MKDINFLKQHNVNVDNSLELFGDIDTYNEMLKEFENSLDDKLNNINNCYLKDIKMVNEDSDITNYTTYVHSLKSDCKYFGFMKLAEMAYEHEMKSKEGDIDYIKEHYQEMMKEASQVKEIVSAYLNDTELKNDHTNQDDEKDNIIIVADDSEVIRMFVTKVFNEHYSIITTKDGQETLHIIKKYQNTDKVKAILLDLNMPVLSGFAVLDYMKEQNLFKTMPVSIISGDSSSEAINRAFTYEIVDMISKPFSETKIKDILDRTISNI